MLPESASLSLSLVMNSLRLLLRRLPSSDFTSPSSLLTSPSSLLTSPSRLLTPHSRLLTPTSRLLIPLQQVSNPFSYSVLSCWYSTVSFKVILVSLQLAWRLQICSNFALVLPSPVLVCPGVAERWRGEVVLVVRSSAATRRGTAGRRG